MSPTPYCPGCRGGIPDPITDYVEWCGEHRLDITGSADALVVTSELWSLYAPSEAEAATNRAICKVIHRDHAPMDYEPPLIPDGRVVGILRPGTLPPVEWDGEPE